MISTGKALLMVLAFCCALLGLMVTGTVFASANSSSASVLGESYRSFSQYHTFLVQIKTVPSSDIQKIAYTSELNNKYKTAVITVNALYKKKSFKIKASTQAKLKNIRTAYQKKLFKKKSAKKALNKNYRKSVKQIISLSKRQIKANTRSRLAVLKLLKNKFSESKAAIQSMPQPTDPTQPTDPKPTDPKPTDPKPTDPTQPTEFNEANLPSQPAAKQQYYYSYKLLGLENAIGAQSVTVAHGASLSGNIGTNGSVIVNGNANVCGTIRYLDQGSEQSGACGAQLTTGSVVLPNVKQPADLKVNNSNNRLAGGDNLDPVDPSVWNRGNVNWNPTTRVLKVTYSSLTLQGVKPYSLCRLEISGGGNLIIDSSSPAQIFFDSPENCPGVSQEQLSVTGGGQISYTKAVPGFYFQGSDTVATQINFNGDARLNGVVVYAPKTDINFSSGFSANGAFIGKNLSLNGGGSVINSLDLRNYLLPI
jgi:hypothetical protein